MAERVIVIAMTLDEAKRVSRELPNVVGFASPTCLSRLRGVAADRVVVNFELSRGEAEVIAAAVRPCLATSTSPQAREHWRVEGSHDSGSDQ